MVWVGLAMAAALFYLGFVCWISSRISFTHFPTPRSLSTSEVQDVIANAQVRKFRFRLFQGASGARALSGDLLENGKMTPFVAPAENSTVALLGETGIGYETKTEDRNTLRRITHTAWWAQRLLNPLCCFILVAGSVTLLRGNHDRQTGSHAVTDLRNERRVDKAFAALAACGMVALAVFRGVTTEWSVRTILAYQVPAIVAQHKNARFEVFEYMDGSRKLWISDVHTPDFIAPANDSTLGALTHAGCSYQTYVAGVAGLPGPSQFNSALWISALIAGAASLLWWAVRRQPVLPLHLQGAGTI
jgi:hypothetical protein